MMDKIKGWVRRYWDVIAYIFFGGITTVVNYIVYLPLYNFTGCSATTSNIIAWVVAVAVAFVTNKPFVFHSYDWSMKTVIPELTKFVSCRLASGAMETLILLIAVDILHWNGNPWKLAATVLVIILNYLSSKLFVFKKKK